jgi:hypothetical protein
MLKAGESAPEKINEVATIVRGGVDKAKFTKQNMLTRRHIAKTGNANEKIQNFKTGILCTILAVLFLQKLQCLFVFRVLQLSQTILQVRHDLGSVCNRKRQ